ncbi:D-alanine--D-alanine ligase family protein [Actinoplanes sp. NBRC 103695]|uniref:D-alanine--D-alanine ligase family protein n=1 Tax=Actinoplanes sp. NBRC 103695 TaxID=3032202 RepID=UPI0024A301C4|nr:D-alanine--D-alanine ligase family protein [Actinoplanes sp. NBRC 103695]GLZ02361.1 D-alanine--D-alanine ligase [Actinoplanes sp. NBRC 103695]
MAGIRIGVLFGGQNTEHEISCNSAAGVLTHLNRERIDPVAVRIAEDGTWRIADREATPAELDGATLKALTGEFAGTRAQTLASAVTALAGLDAVFPVLHGVVGEDGTVPGLLNLLGVPYIGNDVGASAVGMDKEFTKAVLSAVGVSVADGVVLRGPDETLTEQDRERLGLPVFIKPNSGGSSIGVVRISDWADLDAAVTAAFKMDTKVLVERAVPGTEIGISVLEFPDGRVLPSPPVDSHMDPGSYDFLSHEAKYHDSSTTLRIPADLEPRVAADLADQAVRVFRALGCTGLLRVDSFVHTAHGQTSIVLNEVNTLPGLTPASQFPAAWMSTGLTYSELLDILIDTALARGVRSRTARAS